MNLFTIAEAGRYTQFWNTPYRTGNLARSIGDVEAQGDRQVGYRPFNASGEANYGWFLNETPTIRYKTNLNGRIFTGEYKNRHYLWFDNFVDTYANTVALNTGAILL